MMWTYGVWMLKWPVICSPNDGSSESSIGLALQKKKNWNWDHNSSFYYRRETVLHLQLDKRIHFKQCAHGLHCSPEKPFRMINIWVNLWYIIILIRKGKTPLTPFWKLNGTYLWSFESPSHQDAWCQVWLKFAHWSGEEDF